MVLAQPGLVANRKQLGGTVARDLRQFASSLSNSVWAYVHFNLHHSV